MQYLIQDVNQYIHLCTRVYSMCVREPERENQNGKMAYIG